jgi:hypothetical protein
MDEFLWKNSRLQRESKKKQQQQLTLMMKKEKFIWLHQNDCSYTHTFDFV